MSIDLGKLDELTQSAVKSFWRSRQYAAKAQSSRGVSDQGNRGGVTAGKNMDGFIRLVQEIVVKNGLPKASVLQHRRILTIPGFFRPTKQWDVMIIDKGVLIAAIEFKSQVGPSFGNNFNNRTEEAIGSAQDFWTAFREKAFGDIPRPFLGWLMLAEDCGASRSPCRVEEPNYPVLPEFKGASYAERYHLLCQKLVAERLYSSTCLLLSPANSRRAGIFSERSSTTGIRNFAAVLAGHVAASAAMR